MVNLTIPSIIRAMPVVPDAPSVVVEQLPAPPATL